MLDKIGESIRWNGGVKKKNEANIGSFILQGFLVLHLVYVTMSGLFDGSAERHTLGAVKRASFSPKNEENCLADTYVYN